MLCGGPRAVVAPLDRWCIVAVGGVIYFIHLILVFIVLYRLFIIH